MYDGLPDVWRKQDDRFLRHGDVRYSRTEDYGMNISAIASKAGVMGLTKTLALEFARYGITVNCISPGATKTPMLAKMPEEIAEMFMKKIPLRRFAEPEELANAHLFLASEEAGYITGQVIFVDGGISVGF